MMTTRRRSQNPIATLMLIAACCGASADGATIRLWPQAVVTGDQVLLGDLCELQGFPSDQAVKATEIVVAPAPAVGGSIVLSMDSVRQALSAGGFDLSTVVLRGAASCEVVRPRASEPRPSRVAAKNDDGGPASAAAGAGTLRDAIVRYVNQLSAGQVSAGQGGRAIVHFGRVPNQILDLAEPQFAFDIRKTSGRALGLVGLEVTVLSEERVVQKVPLLVNVTFVKPTVVAARPINLGATIDAADVHLVDMNLTRLDQSGFSDPARVIGQRAKRFLAGGEVFKARDLERVPLVKRGQIVDVYSRSGGVVIVTAAKAMQHGAFGDVIELRSNSRSREKTTATVIGPGRVQVGSVDRSRSGEQGILAMGGMR